MSLFCKQCVHSNHSDASFCDVCGVPSTPQGLGTVSGPKPDTRRSRRFRIIAILMLFTTSGLTATLFVPWGVGNAASLEKMESNESQRIRGVWQQQQKEQDQVYEKSANPQESFMDRMIRGVRENPILLIVFLISIGGAFLSIGPMLKAKKIGKVACNKCGHVGKLKQTMTNKLVCSDCGSDDWKLAAQPTFDQNVHVFCSECGTQCTANTAFCNKCGCKIGGI